MYWILTPLSLGFLGSLHCIGMCGPIALALPVHQKGFWGRIGGILAYNIGRSITYGAFGLLLGSVGQRFAYFGYQQALSLVMGILILLGVFFTKYSASQFLSMKPLQRFISSVKNKMIKLFNRTSIGALFSIGLLNGFLPCGLLYVALAGSLTQADPLKSCLFMILFGISTIPLMFSVSYMGKWLSQSLKQRFQHMTPMIVSAMAILLIVRGLNLGIPYFSPKLAVEKEVNSVVCDTVLSCCHKK